MNPSSIGNFVLFQNSHVSVCAFSCQGTAPAKTPEVFSPSLPHLLSSLQPLPLQARVTNSILFFLRLFCALLAVASLIYYMKSHYALMINPKKRVGASPLMCKAMTSALYKSQNQRKISPDNHVNDSRG